MDRRTLEPARALTAPGWWLALAMLVVNDHLLKGSGLLPGALTGKLSDLAGLLVAPVLLATLVRARSRPSVAACFAAIGAVFAAIKISPELAGAWEHITALSGFGWDVVCDPTDLLALPMLWLGWRRWVPRMSSPLPADESHAWRARAGVLFGAAACIATSPARPPEPVTVPGKVFAQAWRGDPVFVIDTRTGQPNGQFDPDGEVLAAESRDGILYVLEEERVVSVSPKAKLLAARPLEGSYQSFLGIDELRLFVMQPAESDGGSEMVIALSRKNLKRLWSRPVAKGMQRRFPKENPVAGAGHLVVPAENQLVALDAATGRVVWIHRASSTRWWPHVGPRGVFVTDGNRTLYRLDAETGKELWRRTMREGAFTERYYEGSPLASAGALLFVHDGQTLFALDPETGQTRWHRPKVFFAAVGDSLIVVRNAGPGYHIAGLQLDGKQRWRATLPEDASLLSPPVIADDDAMVVVRPHDEVLYGYDAANGKLLWTFDLDDGERVVETGGAPLLIKSARR